MELSRKTIISAIVIEVVVLITGAIALGYMAFQSGRAAEIVNDGGLSAPVRTPRGRDIFAACGQLKSASERGRRDKVVL